MYHLDRFHTYRNFPNKRDPDVAGQAKQSIKEYSQHTSITGVIRVIRIAKVNVVRHIQWQCDPCLQSVGLSSPNIGKREDLDL